jgi:hypothetical protein
MSIGLSVSPTSLAMYVDGIEVTSTGQRGWQGEAGSADDLAGTNQANPDAGNFATPLESFYGLPDSILLGGFMADDFTVFFEGSIQALTIFDDALDMYAHDCLFQVLETEVATCADPGQPTWSRSGRVNNYYASFLDASVPDGTTLMGDVFQNGAFGLSFDGDEDYLQITRYPRLRYRRNLRGGILVHQAGLQRARSLGVRVLAARGREYASDMGCQQRR